MATMALDNHKGLFQCWLDIEQAAGKPLKQILDEINAACGTTYKHNWPAKMAEANDGWAGYPNGRAALYAAARLTG